MADITVQNLTKYYGDRLILKDISFDIQPGEKVAIFRRKRRRKDHFTQYFDRQTVV
mgnify:CR=1 FL=1